LAFNITHNGPPAKRRKRLNVAKTALERNEALRFERMPRVSVEELTFAYDKGLIDWPAYQRQMATFCGMAAEDLTTGADPWNKEERLLALTGGTPSTEFGKDPRGGGI